MPCLGALPFSKDGGGWQCRCRGTRSGSASFQVLWSTRQAELACTFPSAGAGEGKEHARRKYSCSRALLSSVQREHVQGGQRQKGRFRKRVWERIGGGQRKAANGEEKLFICAQLSFKDLFSKARANILKVQDRISWVPVIVPPESTAFHSSSIMCVCLTLIGSSASSDLKLSRTLPLASACQMCSSPCCTWNYDFHSWLRQVSEECEARGMPVPAPAVGLDWSVSSLGQGLCPGGCGYSTHCPWQLRDFCLCSCPSHPSHFFLIAAHLFLPLCCSSFSLS